MHLKRAVIVHGGAWKIPNRMEKSCLTGVKKAARLAMDNLVKTDSALDAVEMAVRCMEDDPAFDAGTGSVLNVEGEVELDAGIMDGRRLIAGAVAAVRNIRNPISLARKVMENSEHVFLVGEGANKFAESQGVERFGGLITKKELARWKTLHEKYRATMKFSERSGTVGAVAISSCGDVASATSTGGVPFKLPGRVGDSCLIGCGLYADNKLGGVSATGHGESIMRICLSKSVCEFLARGDSAQKAAERAVKNLEKRVDGRAGVIVLDKKERVGVFYNTPKMVRAYMREGMPGPQAYI